MDSALVQGVIVGGVVYGGLMQLKPDFMYTAGGQLKDEKYSPLNAALLVAALFVAFRVFAQGQSLMPTGFGAETTYASPGANIAGEFASTARAGVADTFFE